MYKIYQQIKDFPKIDKLVLFRQLKEDIFKNGEIDIRDLIEKDEDHVIINNPRGLFYIWKVKPYMENVVLRGIIHEPETEEFVKNNIKDGDIVHAGAGFGDSIVQFEKFINPNQMIWAFEPIPESFKCVKINLLLNDCTNVVIRNLGLSNKCGDKNFITKYKKDSHRGVAVAIVEQETEMTEKLFCSTIDVEIPKRRKIDIIHLDVEYHEQYALEGGLKTIQRNLPIIIIETLPSDEWLENNLYTLGYNKIRKVDKNTVFSCGEVV